ncbi:MAG: tetratricopeptide repeat protein [Prevotella sp.]
MYRKLLFFILTFFPLVTFSQYNIDRLLMIGRSALYFEDYVLSMQYFNQAISAKPYLYEPWYYRAVAKYYLDDYVGAESDCSEAIERNPYVVGLYELRGLSRIRQEKFDGAVDDYTKALKYAPQIQGLWHNRVLCRIQQKSYDAALADIDTMLTQWKKYARGYSMRAEVYLMQKDTLKAIESLEKSIELDRYDGSTWSARAIISLARGDWKQSEEYLNKAIHLSPKQVGNYINRALARVNQNNLRGAMADYDMAIDLDPNNFLGHYNRGLLRAQVGDDNRAITDFDFVLSLEPDNVMALFNRALLLDKTGDLKGAVRDYSKVIDEFPNFWTGLHYRADCYRRMGMTKQAENDEFRIYKAQLYKHLYGRQPRLDKDKIRKRSEIDPDKYNQLVVADEQEVEHEYENEYRGRVQNHKVEVAFMQMFELSYVQYRTEVKPFIAYDKLVDTFNQQVKPAELIYLNCTPTVLNEQQSTRYFAYIDSLSAAMLDKGSSEEFKSRLLNRAVGYSVTQNFESAIEDLSACIKLDSTSALAYWQRAVCQSKVNEFNESQGTDVTLKTSLVLSDLREALMYHSNCAYLHYNIGCVYAERKDYSLATEAFTKAIELDSNLAEAYYNRGIARIFSEKTEEGISDLSKAGELGLYTAYSVIKKYRK